MTLEEKDRWLKSVRYWQRAYDEVAKDRDAAMEDLKKYAPCPVCKHVRHAGDKYSVFEMCCEFRKYRFGRTIHACTHWQWRGVQIGGDA